MGNSSPPVGILSHSTILLNAFLACIVLVHLAVAQEHTKEAKPDYTIYHTLNQVLEESDSIANRCSSIMRIETRTMNSDNYTSSMKIITVEPSGLSSDHSKKARLLINFGEHGRELISPEIALNLLKSLCDSRYRTELMESYNISSSTVDAVLEHVVFQIVPVENPNGRQLVENGALCERKNGRGVDPNRNWEVDWGVKEDDYDPNEEFPGSKPFSEPEASILRAVATQFKPHVWLNVHSGMEAMFLPYDHKNQLAEGKSAQVTLDILHKMNKEFCGGRCAVGPGGKTVGYFAHGTATDYMHDVLGVGLVMTWEVYGDEEAEYTDCFRMFNPLTRDGYRAVVNQWTASVYGLLAALPGHPAINLQDLSDDTVSSLNLGRKGGNEQTKKKDSSSIGRLHVLPTSTSSSVWFITSNARFYVVLGMAGGFVVIYLLCSGARRWSFLGKLRQGRRRQIMLPL